MLYSTPTKGDDGLYFVKALNDSKRKCLVQLNKVKVVDVSGDITFDLESEANIAKIQAIDEQNLVAARENCESWFGKQLSEKVIDGAYTSSMTSGQLTGDLINFTKVFNAQQEQVSIDKIEMDSMCDMIVEFAGIWFAKKTFGSAWNVVQVRLHPEPEPEPILDCYPEDYAFVDEEE